MQPAENGVMCGKEIWHRRPATPPLGRSCVAGTSQSTTPDRSLTDRRWCGDGRALVQPLVGASLIIIADIAVQYSAQMGLADDEQVVEALLTHR